MDLLAQAASAPSGDTAEIVMFWVFGVIAVGSALAVVTMRNIVHGALMLVLNLLGLAGLYLTLESPFLAVIQVLVYGGAIMVLFLFVVMLLGVDRDDLLLETRIPTRVLSIAGAALLAGAMLFAFVGPYTSDASRCGDQAGSGEPGAVECVGLAEQTEQAGGSVAFLGRQLFSRHTYPFELAALLLTVATIGATVMGRREDPPRQDPVAAPVTVGAGGGPDGAHDRSAGDDGSPAPGEAQARDADRLLPDDREER